MTTDHNQSTRRAAPSPTETGEAEGGIGSLRILLIEDSSHMRTILATVLKSFGVRLLKEADSVEAGFHHLRYWKPDVVFLDLCMIGPDGLDFARSVRNWRDSPAPEIPIIVVSANSEWSRVAQARDAGVNEFLAKPIRASDVWNRLTAVIYSDRPFVRSDLYYGPDRRRRSKPGYAGPFRRKSDKGKTREVEFI